jgi:hypothetical protein
MADIPYLEPKYNNWAKDCLLVLGHEFKNGLGCQKINNSYYNMCIPSGTGRTLKEHTIHQM